MANSALIDDLLKQFAENPRRVFARLANEYRKRGELDSAIEICRSHVPLQPGYISGHIVLGQALYDRGTLDDARVSFETALTLDPENLIALRHMGDIARAGGDFDAARGWYRQLLEIDPQNEEVSAQLESMNVADAQPDSAVPTEPDAFAGWGEVVPEPVDIAGERDTPAQSAILDQEEHAEEHTEEHAEEEVVDRELAAERAPEPETVAEASAAAALAIEGIFDAPEAMYGDAVEATAEEVPPSSADAEADEDGATEAAPESGTEASFATETMAELYLQQGFPERALEIYRELAARNPADDSLRERIAELDEEDAPPPAVPALDAGRTAREFFGVLAYRRAPRTSAAESELESPLGMAHGTSGSAVLAVEEAVAAPVPDVEVVETFAERIPTESTPGPVTDEYGAQAAWTDGEDATAPGSSLGSVESDVELVSGSVELPVRATPGREADSALSLDNVFHDAPPMDGSSSRNGLSFDEFFARRTNGSVEHAGEAATEDAASDVPAEESTAADEPRDLELFHAWLDGLKG